MLVAYDVALDLVRALRPVVAQLRAFSREAADQIERAASSIVLNIAEGERRHGRDPRRFFDMAHGSAGEIRGALDLADAWGWPMETGQARALLDRELSLLWGLTRRGRSTDTPDHPRSAMRMKSSRSRAGWWALVARDLKVNLKSIVDVFEPEMEWIQTNVGGARRVPKCDPGPAT